MMTLEEDLKQKVMKKSEETPAETFQRKWLAELRSEMEVGIVLTIVENMKLPRIDDEYVFGDQQSAERTRYRGIPRRLKEAYNDPGQLERLCKLARILYKRRLLEQNLTTTFGETELSADEEKTLAEYAKFLPEALRKPLPKLPQKQAEQLKRAIKTLSDGDPTADVSLLQTSGELDPLTKDELKTILGELQKREEPQSYMAGYMEQLKKQTNLSMSRIHLEQMNPLDRYASLLMIARMEQRFGAIKIVQDHWPRFPKKLRDEYGGAFGISPSAQSKHNLGNALAATEVISGFIYNENFFQKPLARSMVGSIGRGLYAPIDNLLCLSSRVVAHEYHHVYSMSISLLLYDKVYGTEGEIDYDKFEAINAFVDRTLTGWYKNDAKNELGYEPGSCTQAMPGQEREGSSEYSVYNPHEYVAENQKSAVLQMPEKWNALGRAAFKQSHDPKELYTSLEKEMQDHPTTFNDQMAYCEAGWTAGKYYYEDCFDLDTLKEFGYSSSSIVKGSAEERAAREEYARIRMDSKYELLAAPELKSLSASLNVLQDLKRSFPDLYQQYISAKIWRMQRVNPFIKYRSIDHNSNPTAVAKVNEKDAVAMLLHEIKINLDRFPEPGSDKRKQALEDFLKEEWKKEKGEGSETCEQEVNLHDNTGDPLTQFQNNTFTEGQTKHIRRKV